MKTLQLVYRIVDNLTHILIFVLLAVMVANTAVSVFYRYVLNNAISWSEEASRYLMIWLGFFGMSLATRDRAHVGITFVVNALPAPLRRFFLYLVDLIVLAFLVLLLILSIREIHASQGQTTAALLLPMAIPYAAVTTGASLMLLQALRRTIDLVREHLGLEELL